MKTSGSQTGIGGIAGDVKGKKIEIIDSSAVINDNNEATVKLTDIGAIVGRHIVAAGKGEIIVNNSGAMAKHYVANVNNPGEVTRATGGVAYVEYREDGLANLNNLSIIANIKSTANKVTFSGGLAGYLFRLPELNIGGIEIKGGIEAVTGLSNNGGIIGSAGSYSNNTSYYEIGGKGLKIDGASVEFDIANSGANASSNVGGAWGSLYTNAADAKLNNITVVSDFTCAGALSNSGGIVGYIKTINGSNIAVNSSSYEGNIKSANASKIGGNVGCSNASMSINNCSAYSRLTFAGNADWLGGLAGDLEGKSLTVKNSTADINATSTNGSKISCAAGIVGLYKNNTDASIIVVDNNDASKMYLSEFSTAGQITKGAGAFGQIEVEGGSVQINNINANSKFLTTGSNIQYCGGLVGYVQQSDSISINNANADSTITSKSSSVQYCGGLVGQMIHANSVSINKANVTGAVQAKSGVSYTGGMLGYGGSSSGVITSICDNGFTVDKSTVNYTINNTGVNDLGKIGGVLGYIYSGEQGVKVTDTSINCSFTNNGKCFDTAGVLGAFYSSTGSKAHVGGCNIVTNMVAGAGYTANANGFERCGGVAGMIGKEATASSGYLEVENVTVKGYLKAENQYAAGYRVAGIAGLVCNGSTLTNCLSELDITTTRELKFCGGMIGEVSGKCKAEQYSTSILGGVNKGDFSGGNISNTGGIVGGMVANGSADDYIQKLTIGDCTVNGSVIYTTNYGNITAVTKFEQVGGIIGHTFNGNVSNVLNLGKMSVLSGNTVKNVGGIVGYIQYSSGHNYTSNFKGNVNKGDIEAVNATDVNNVGGIYGELSINSNGIFFDDAQYTNSYNIGKITVKSIKANVGGIVGLIETKENCDANIKKHYTIGNVVCLSDPDNQKKYSTSGSLVGYISNKNKVSIIDCYTVNATPVGNNVYYGTRGSSTTQLFLTGIIPGNTANFELTKSEYSLITLLSFNAPAYPSDKNDIEAWDKVFAYLIK